MYVHPVTHTGTLSNAFATSCIWYIATGTLLLRKNENIRGIKKLHNLDGASESKVLDHPIGR